MRAVDDELLRVARDHELGVLLRVRGVPTVRAPIRNPDTGPVPTIEADDEVDIRVDGAELAEVDALVEVELDRAVAAQVHARVRIASRADLREDHLRERL